ncbi:hypothetical protein QAD02_021247 [Eretmocerus hayati]|uniref:Uncharacterized protein n=1 Tax=Eretmocerus hayati TaxID=131215 RepID=A0ACC2PQ62_9HYME|nr:hypothetical protein QAD02_021247 [Eretmocerus hayati]
MDLSDDESDNDEAQEENFVRNLEAQGELLKQNLLPVKSRREYELAYAHFSKWLHDNRSPPITENILMLYFEELSHTYSPPTLWSKWSMIKTLLNLRSNIKMGDFQNLKQFLKNFNKSFKAKQAAVFRWEDIEKFLRDAENFIYSAMKVVLIFGICGAMRCDEMVKLLTTDVRDMASPVEMNEQNQNQFQFYVSINDTKTFNPRSFVIGSIFYSTVKAYIDLRPTNWDNSRLFIFYSKGKCSRQNMGKNRPGDMAKNIAAYLGLKNQGDFTGHSFRRTAATLLSNSGANFVAVKALGGWVSDSVAQGYIENSEHNRGEIFEGIVSANKTLTTMPLQSGSQFFTASRTLPSTHSTKNPHQFVQRHGVRATSVATKSDMTPVYKVRNQSTPYSMRQSITQAQINLPSHPKKNTHTTTSTCASESSSIVQVSSASASTASCAPPSVSSKVKACSERSIIGTSPPLGNVKNTDSTYDGSGDRIPMDQIDYSDLDFETDGMNNNLETHSEILHPPDDIRGRRICPSHQNKSRSTVQIENYQSIDMETSFVQFQDCTITNSTINKSS